MILRNFCAAQGRTISASGNSQIEVTGDKPPPVLKRIRKIGRVITVEVGLAENNETNGRQTCLSRFDVETLLLTA